VRLEGFYVKEKSTDTSCDRTSDLPIDMTPQFILLFLCVTGPFSCVAKFLASYVSRRIILNYRYVFGFISIYVAA